MALRYLRDPFLAQQFAPHQLDHAAAVVGEFPQRVAAAWPSIKAGMARGRAAAARAAELKAGADPEQQPERVGYWPHLCKVVTLLLRPGFALKVLRRRHEKGRIASEEWAALAELLRQPSMQEAAAAVSVAVSELLQFAAAVAAEQVTAEEESQELPSAPAAILACQAKAWAAAHRGLKGAGVLGGPLVQFFEGFWSTYVGEWARAGWGWLDSLNCGWAWFALLCARSLFVCSLLCAGRGAIGHLSSVRAPSHAPLAHTPSCRHDHRGARARRLRWRPPGPDAPRRRPQPPAAAQGGAG